MNIHSISIKGLREQNEDQHDIITNINNNNRKYKNVNFYGVYDGHGGKEVSTQIQKKLSKYFINKNVKYPLNKNYVYNVYNKIQENLKKKEYAQFCGSTCLAVIHFLYKNNQYINVLNTGDSRCVLCRDNFALPLTKDHKPHWPEEKNRIEKLGGQIKFDGYDWRIKSLSVSRAFGDFDSTPYVSHTPDIFRYKIDNNDKFFILACDGLWDVCSNFDAVNFVLSFCYDNTTNIRINKNINIAKKLAEYALKKGSTDNITIIVVFLQ